MEKSDEKPIKYLHTKYSFQFGKIRFFFFLRTEHFIREQQNSIHLGVVLDFRYKEVCRKW